MAFAALAAQTIAASYAMFGRDATLVAPDLATRAVTILDMADVERRDFGRAPRVTQGRRVRIQTAQSRPAGAAALAAGWIVRIGPADYVVRQVFPPDDPYGLEQDLDLYEAVA